MFPVYLTVLSMMHGSESLHRTCWGIRIPTQCLEYQTLYTCQVVRKPLPPDFLSMSGFTIPGFLKAALHRETKLLVTSRDNNWIPKCQAPLWGALQVQLLLLRNSWILPHRAYQVSPTGEQEAGKQWDARFTSNAPTGFGNTQYTK